LDKLISFVPLFEVGSGKNVKFDVIMYYGPEQMDGLCKEL